MTEQNQQTPEQQSPPERLKDQHFDYVLVMGQGPVQEADRIPETGRQGLNFYSRLIAMSAAALLENGIADKIILSGGETGSRKGTPEAQTEAELMADIIRRKLKLLSSNGSTFVVKGKTISINDCILIENEAKYTLQNFTLTLNKHIDKKKNPLNPDMEKATLAILGIGFHAHDTHNNTKIGRLEKLADIFDINGRTYSAEEVLQELVIDEKKNDSFVRQELSKLTAISRDDEISKLKSELERLYILGQERGDWVKEATNLNDPDRVRKMILKDKYVREKFYDQHKMNEEQIQKIEFSALLQKMRDLNVEGCPDYEEAKNKLEKYLRSKTQQTKINYLGKYFVDTPSPLQKLQIRTTK